MNYSRMAHSKLTIVKIGGKVIDDPDVLRGFIADFSQLPEPLILVHGGGSLASQTAGQLGQQPVMVDGRRITDAAMLDVVVMVYAGLVNKTIVSLMRARGMKPIGLTGADAGTITAHKRKVTTIDYGYAGDIDRVNTPQIDSFLRSGLTPVFCAVTDDGMGQLLNTNADTIAASLATALSANYEVDLLFLFGFPGVMKGLDSGEVHERLTPGIYSAEKKAGRLDGGIIPKLDNAFETLQKGVSRVVICHPAALPKWNTPKFTGTVIEPDDD